MPYFKDQEVVMSQIELQQVCKTFVLRKRQKGLLGAMRGAVSLRLLEVLLPSSAYPLRV